ncbi:MAG: class I SAM-dependent methyltransferase [Actinomycetota bacterium]|nr:class I SAM-dependent methyltransferase [Actinomycetota bacterium]
MTPGATGLPCRSCSAPLTRTFVDLGETPLANAYLDAGQLSAPEPRYPLHARVCDRCLLVQVDQVVPAEVLFSDYAYFSSYSDSWVAHARRFAEAVRPRFGIDGHSQVVEVASNDGYLLRHFAEMGVPVLGVEPAENVAAVARAAGVPTEARFFGAAFADELRGRGVRADLLVANNVVAHVPDLNDFVAGLRLALAPEGVLSVEFPHLLNLIEKAQFDTIYHEHFCYFSLRSLEEVFARHGLRVFDVEELPTHGGSLRVLACLGGASHAETAGVAALRRKEAAAGLLDLATYAGFGDKVDAARRSFRAFLDECRTARRTVVAYGATAKGNTLLNSTGVGVDDIAYVVDRNPHKQGRYLPGSRLPIRAPEEIKHTRPEVILLLAWNLVEEVAEQLSFTAEWGARMVVPIPTVRTVP